MYIDFIIGGLAIAFVVGVFTKSVIDKKKGKTSCCCDCTKCMHQCKAKEKDN